MSATRLLAAIAELLPAIAVASIGLLVHDTANGQDVTGVISTVDDEWLASQTGAQTRPLAIRCNNAYKAGQYVQSVTACNALLAESIQADDARAVAEARYRVGASLAQANHDDTALTVLSRSTTEAEAAAAPRLQLYALNSQANIHRARGDADTAIALYTSALALEDDIDTVGVTGRNTLIQARAHRGAAYYQRAEYALALDDLETAKAAYEEIGHVEGTTSTQINLGLVHQALGDHRFARTEYTGALERAREADDSRRTAESLVNLGYLAETQREHAVARDYFAEAARFYSPEDPGLAVTLNNLGVSQGELGDYDAAEQNLDRALALSRATENRALEGRTLDSLATVQAYQGRRVEALETYHRAFLIESEVGDRDGQRTTLANIGRQLADDYATLAIVFYKQSINVTEAIRGDIESLPAVQRSSYARTVQDTYRELSELLIRQDRVLEAQLVMDLLKVEELEGYLGHVRSGAVDGDAVPTAAAESTIVHEYEALAARAIEIARDIEQLVSIPRDDRTPEEDARLTELIQLEQQLNLEFSRFINSDEVRAAVDQLHQADNADLEELETLRSIGNTLRQVRTDHGLTAVVLYPLVLDDSLELIVATHESRPIHRRVQVNREDLRTAVGELRAKLLDPTSDAKPAAKRLYEWLVRPIEPELHQLQAQAIWFAPDDALRYVPLAALHDDGGWLVERFQINNWTSASKMNLTDTIDPDLRILGGAFTNVTYSLTIADRLFNFLGLPFAGKEVETLDEYFERSLFLSGTEFVFDQLYRERSQYNVLHLATHAAVIPGQASDSFLVFGDGQHRSIRDFDQLDFDLDLAVLSACETALGGQQDGVEILGLGYAMQEGGARSTVASLWRVSDGGTHALMSAFYGFLKDGLGRADALRKAQLALIENDATTIDSLNRGLVLDEPVRASLDHPYYWAPFIIVGSGL